jgi:hypothetical protein
MVRYQQIYGKKTNFAKKKRKELLIYKYTFINILLILT